MSKTLEELQIELDAVKKQNLEIQLKAENEKLRVQEEQKKTELAQKERAELKKEVTEEIKKELGYSKESKIGEPATQESMNLSGDRKHIEFKEQFIARRTKTGKKLTGRSYEDYMDDFTQGGYK